MRPQHDNLHHAIYSPRLTQVSRGFFLCHAGLRDKPVGGDKGVFYTVGNHEEAVMTIEQRLERLERRTNRYRNALVMLVMSVCSVALIGGGDR